jgi:hypothetical protein
MADSRINELMIFINQEIVSLEDQLMNLAMAKALTEVSLGDDFLDKPKTVRHAYLSNLDDILERAIGLNEASIELLQIGIKGQEAC